MGRPLKKKFFGDLAIAGSQIQLQADLGAGVVTAYILRQEGTGSYLATDGAVKRIVKLVETITGPGQATLSVTPFGSAVEYARVVNSHVVKTFEGKVYRWQLVPATAEGFAEIENS